MNSCKILAVARAFGAALVLAFAPRIAFAFQIFNQPVEIIEAESPSSFQDRSGYWPTTDIPEDLLFSESRPLTDPLNATPGVQARIKGSPTLSIRGSAHADRVLKLYEGVPLNLADGVGASGLFVPNEALASLQLFKGPASVFFGSSAMAGAVNHRQRLFERPAARLGVADDTGWLGSRSLFAAVPLGSIKRQNNFGQVTAFYEKDPGRYAYRSVSGPFTGRREHNSVETARATGYGEFKLSSVRLKTRLIAASLDGESPNSLYTPSISTLLNTGTLYSLEASHHPTATSKFEARLSDVRVWGLYNRDTPTQGTSFTSRTALALDYGAQPTGKLYIRTFMDGTVDRLTADYVEGATYNETHFEAGQSFEIQLAPTLTLQPAYRYRANSGDLLKALGLISDDGRLRSWLTYSEGFRAPSLSDRFSNSSDLKGNIGLSPERSKAVEAGFQKNNGQRYDGFFDGTTYGGSIYAINYTDFIYSIVDSNGASTYINSGAARAYGLEASVATSVSFWQLSATYNYLDAENKDTGTVLNLSPQHQLTLQVSQQIGFMVFALGNTNWSSYFDRDPVAGGQRELPSWSTVDFTVRTLGMSQWEIKGGILNIIDAPRELTLGFPEPQRRFFASALRYF